jgi:hypothetical protein
LAVVGCVRVCYGGGGGGDGCCVVQPRMHPQRLPRAQWRVPAPAPGHVHSWQLAASLSSGGSRTPRRGIAASPALAPTKGPSLTVALGSSNPPSTHLPCLQCTASAETNLLFCVVGGNLLHGRFLPARALTRRWCPSRQGRQRRPSHRGRRRCWRPTRRWRRRHPSRRPRRPRPRGPRPRPRQRPHRRR